MDIEKYEKPMVMTVEIPERTAYACNLNDASCGHVSNLINHAICMSTNSLSAMGICG